jgi:hypothetical protein
MLDKLSLPGLTYDQYRELIDNKSIICLTDILSLDNYSELRPTVTIAEALSAIVPIEVVSDSLFFERFVNSCGNLIDSVMYYLKNPGRIVTELGLDSMQCAKFITWISDPYNLTSVTALFSSVELKARSKKFEGSPIFRSNAFILTGSFKRGSYKEIASILESYEATVITDIAGKRRPEAVIVGGTNEDISGLIIKSAKAADIPIIEEDDFFRMYGIDQDLAANLL